MTSPHLDLDRLLASVDLDSTHSTPLQSSDLSARPLVLPPPTRMERIIGTVDLVIDHIEPFLTGDFLRATRDLPQTGGTGRPTEDLLVVDRILGSVEIVVDAKDLLEEEVEEEPAAQEMAASALSHGLSVSRDLYTRARADLDAGRFAEARPLLERLASAHPENTEYAAAAAFARYSLASPEGRAEEAQRLVEHAERYPFCASTQRYLGRMYLGIGDGERAAFHLRAAFDLEPGSAVELELRQAHELVARAHGGPTMSPPVLRDRDADILPATLVTFAAVWVLLHLLAIEVDLGVYETAVRAAVLSAAALVAARAVLAHRPLVAGDWVVALRPALVAIAFGVALGAALPARTMAAPLALALGVAAVQATAEELFFRVFAGRALLHGLVGALTPILAGGALYAIYQLTIPAQWDAVAAGELLPIVFRGFAAGALYTFVHAKSGSFVPPFLCHLAAAITMVLI